jgi:hypothetical protein
VSRLNLPPDTLAGLGESAVGVSYKVPPTRLVLKDDQRLVPFLLWLYAGGRTTSIWEWLNCRYDAATRTLLIPGGWEKAAETPYVALMDCVLPLLDRRQPAFTAVLKSEDQGDGPGIMRWRYRASSLVCDFKNRYSEHPRDTWIADHEQRIDAQGRWWDRIHAVRGVRHMSEPTFGQWQERTPITTDSLLGDTKLPLNTDAMSFEARYGSPNLLLAQWRVALEEEVGHLEGAEEHITDPERAAMLKAVAFLCRSFWTLRNALHWLIRTERAPMVEAFGELFAVMHGRPQLDPETVAELERIATPVRPKGRRVSSRAADKTSDAAAHARGLAKAVLALNAGDSAALAASFEEVQSIEDWAGRPEWMALLRRAPELGMTVPVPPPAGVEKKLWSWIRGNTRSDPGPDLRDDPALDDLATNVRVMAKQNARIDRRDTAARAAGGDAGAHEAAAEAASTGDDAEGNGDAPAPKEAPRWFEAELLAIPIGQTPSWEQGFALIDRLAETPWSQWTPHRELEVREQEPAKMAAGLRAVLTQLQREWDQPQHYMRVRNVGGRDVFITGDWMGNGAGPTASFCNRVRLLEWAGVAANLGFVED